MRRKDLLLVAGFAGLVLALLAPAWARPGWAVSNYGDLYAYHYPLRHLVASTLQAGRMPFWNPYIFAGVPLLANPQSVLFYPISLLSFLFPLASAFTWDYAFHWVWAAAGVILLARREGLGRWACAVLAALFALSPFLVYRVTEGIPTLLASLSWVPWCWLAWAARRPLLLAGVFALQFLSGHPQFLVINAFGMGLWGALSPSRRVLLPDLAKGAAGAMALALLQWLPTCEFLGLSVRKGWPRAFMTGYSLDWRSLLTLARADAWGNPLDGTYAGPPSVFFETSGLFLGAAGLLLAGAGLWRAKGRGSLLLLGAGLFLAFGGNNPAYLALLSWGPMGFLRTPSRFLLLCLWGLVLAAAAGARSLEDLGPKGRLARALLLAALAFELLAWDRRFVAAEPARALAPNRAVAAAVGGRPFRILTHPELANPDKALLYRARNANGYEAFFLAGFPEYAARSEGKPAVDSSRAYLERHDTPAMSRLGVAYRLNPDGTLEANPHALPLAHFEDGEGRALPERPEVELPRAELWRVRASAPAAARALVAAEADFPGWRAWLDGRPVALERWEGHLRAVRLTAPDAGKALELDLRFSPSLWGLWAALSALAWLVWLARGLGAALRAA